VPTDRRLAFAAAAQAAAGLYWIGFEVLGGDRDPATRIPIATVLGAVTVALAVPLAQRRRWAYRAARAGSLLAVLAGALLAFLLTAPNLEQVSAFPPPPFVSGALGLVALPLLFLGRPPALR
jgi:hypothetical protein